MLSTINETCEMLMELAPAAVYIFVFLFGVCVGSFLNVVIYRLPKKESIVVVPSHCMTCGKKLHWYELIPLFSFLALRGKCLGCKTKLSPQYPIVEAANALLWVLVLYVKGLGIDMLLCQCFITALFAIAVIDARTKIIPPGLNYFIGVLGLIRLALNLDTWLDKVLGLVVMGALFGLIIFFSNGRAMGGGDFKLVCCAGIFVGLKLSLFTLVFSCVFGSIIHVILMKTKKIGRELAFGPYLAAGYAVAVLWGQYVVDWYMKLLAF